MRDRPLNVRVSTDPRRHSARLLEFGTLRQSYVDLEDPAYLRFSYVQAVACALDTMRPAARPLRALHLGAGGLTIPRYLAHSRPQSSSLVAEISPVVLRIGREELGFDEVELNGSGIAVELGDARAIAEAQPSGQYDVVVGDAFADGTVPLHLTTREFMTQVRRMLTDDGMYLLNLIDAPPMRFLRSVLAATDATFRHVAVSAMPEVIAGEDSGNLVIHASEVPLPVTELAEALARCNPPLSLVHDSGDLTNLIADAPILTDELAAAEPRLNRRDEED
ncbi:MAG TPA: fused MFS/spermidine synthase [Mycobacteriales bacterium]|jgi:spermidine synthase|nr:fused MFS/spermidine synthase [Mycobacteriales bacterium]